MYYDIQSTSSHRRAIVGHFEEHLVNHTLLRIDSAFGSQEALYASRPLILLIVGISVQGSILLDLHLDLHQGP